MQVMRTPTARGSKQRNLALYRAVLAHSLDAPLHGGSRKANLRAYGVCDTSRVMLKQSKYLAVDVVHLVWLSLDLRLSRNFRSCTCG